MIICLLQYSSSELKLNSEAIIIVDIPYRCNLAQSHDWNAVSDHREGST